MKKYISIFVTVMIFVIGLFSLLSTVCYMDRFPVQRTIFVGMSAVPYGGDADVVVCIVN